MPARTHSNAEDCIAHLIENLVGPTSAKREGLLETPKRYIAAMQALTAGYSARPETFLKTFEDGAEGYDQLVFQGQIQLYSLCEHHMLPFFGVAHIGYIPDKKIIGLSKIARVVDMFAQRFQVQERLTRQVMTFLESYLQPKAVGVVIRCRHMCMEMRGVQKPGTITYTSALEGDFKYEPEARAEFMKFVGMADGGLHI
jgi:GTP cyclohydrolase I